MYTVKKDTGPDDKTALTAEQVFVTTRRYARRPGGGAHRPQPGAEVVTAGQLKLRNGTPVLINNAVSRQTTPTPTRRTNSTMKRFTDLFIARPVLAIAVSILILVLGLRAVGSLPVQQYPQTENATITITTTYPGASPDVVAGFMTTPIENAVAQVNGIDYMTSTSQTSTSTITINLVLNHNPDQALTEISAKVNSVLNQLPTGTQQPVLTLQVGQTLDAMYIAFRSTVLTAEPDHRLRDARGTAAIAGGERRADGGDPRRAEFRHAGLAESAEARRLRVDGVGCLRGSSAITISSRRWAIPRAR